MRISVEHPFLDPEVEQPLAEEPVAPDLAAGDAVAPRPALDRALRNTEVARRALGREGVTLLDSSHASRSVTAPPDVRPYVPEFLYRSGGPSR